MLSVASTWCSYTTAESASNGLLIDVAARDFSWRPRAAWRRLTPTLDRPADLMSRGPGCDTKLAFPPRHGSRTKSVWALRCIRPGAESTCPLRAQDIVVLSHERLGPTRLMPRPHERAALVSFRPRCEDAVPVTIAPREKQAITSPRPHLGAQIDRPSGVSCASHVPFAASAGAADAR